MHSDRAGVVPKRNKSFTRAGYPLPLIRFLAEDSFLQFQAPSVLARLQSFYLPISQEEIFIAIKMF